MFLRCLGVFYITFFILLGAAIEGSVCAAPASEEKASEFREVNLRASTDEVIIDWNLTPTTLETFFTANTMEGLVRYDEFLRPQPCLAEKWEVLHGGTLYRFHLRKGVRWSDGVELTAEHFRDSWIRLLEPATHAYYANYLFDIQGAQDFYLGKLTDATKVGIRVVNPYLLEVKLNHSVPYFVMMTTFWATFPIRMDLIQKYKDQWTEVKNLVTLGPYRLAEWDKKKKLTYEVNERYWGRKPVVSKVQVWVEPNVGKQLALFKEKKIDMILNPSTDELSSLGGRIGEHDLKMFQYPYLVTSYLGFNLKKIPTSNLEIRKAIAYAFNRQDLAMRLQSGFYPAHSFVPPEVFSASQGQNILQFSEPLAIQTLGRAGYIEGKFIQRLDFYVEQKDLASEIVQYVSMKLKTLLGIEVIPHVLPSMEFRQALKEGKQHLYWGAWSADYPDPSNFFSIFKSKSTTNRAGYSNLQYDQWIDQANQTLDAELRKTRFLDAEKALLQTDVVIVPLMHRRNNVLLGPKLEEAKINPMNEFRFFEIKLRALQ